MPPPRPELSTPAEIFYNAAGARQYDRSTRIQTVQRQLTHRALELLNLAPGSKAFLLDVGCGSGVSGDVLTEAGHSWIGVDLSVDMLRIAKSQELSRSEDDDEDNDDADEGGDTTIDEGSEAVSASEDGEVEEAGEAEGDNEGVMRGPALVEVVRNDMGQGVPFRPGSFDGVVSISAVQWLCYSNQKGHVPQRRLRALFQSLYNCLRRGAKAVLQFYPENPMQTEMITRAAMQCGFGGGVVIDFPHSAKAKKHYLVIQAGQLSGVFVPPQPLVQEDDGGPHKRRRVDDSDADGSESDEDYDSGDGSDEENGDVTRDRVHVGGRERIRHGHDHSHRKRRRKDNRPVTGTKEWVQLKKAERRKFGLPTTADSKYTMRKRRPRF